MIENTNINDLFHKTRQFFEKIDLNDFFTRFNEEYYPFIHDIFEDDEFVIEDIIDNEVSDKNVKIKYEDKYLKEVREMSKDYNFDDIELEMVNMTMREYYRALVDNHVNEINMIKEEIVNLNQEILELQEYDPTDSKSSDGILEYTEEDLKLRIERYTKKIAVLEGELANKQKMETESMNHAKEEIYKIRLNKLTNSILLEKTPLGNVLMFYNSKRGVFEYFSDNTIPYRYLETVGRKYVKTFHCRRVYYDMEEELKLYEEKMKQKEQMEKEKLEREQQMMMNKTGVLIDANKKEKNVFAKFKAYNKESGTGHVSLAPPPKNSIPNTNTNTSKKNEPILLKENANRYTYEGKLSNFSMIKKVPLKAIDKKYAMTFADFKKMNKK